MSVSGMHRETDHSGRCVFRKVSLQGPTEDQNGVQKSRMQPLVRKIIRTTMGLTSISNRLEKRIPGVFLQVGWAIPF